MSTRIGVIFDFDDTLAPDSTTYLLKKLGIDPEKFWNEDFVERIQKGYDPTVAYLSLLIDHTRNQDDIDPLTPDNLEEYARDLNGELYPGIPGVFEDLNDVAADYNEVTVEYYVVSEGIERLIAGSTISDYCRDIYASRLATDDDGYVSGIKRPISFTDKTRYLYEIHKGISTDDARKNPFKVNREYTDDEKRIPFKNFIYIGDGITDIPCFSLVKEREGRVFGVMKGPENSPKQEAILGLGSPRRAGNLNKPDFSPDSRLGSLLRLTIEGMCTDNTIDQLEAL